MKHKNTKDLELVKNIIPEFFENITTEEKLDLLNSDQTEDNIKIDLLNDDSFMELDSFSNLDQNQIKKIPLEKRLSILIRRESKKNNMESQDSWNVMKSMSLKTPKVLHKIPTEVMSSKNSNNEELLNALDSMEDNLLDEELSFGRISCLELKERNSIIHGPSFRENQESTERISRRSSSKYL